MAFIIYYVQWYISKIKYKMLRKILDYVQVLIQHKRIMKSRKCVQMIRIFL